MNGLAFMKKTQKHLAVYKIIRTFAPFRGMRDPRRVPHFILNHTI